MRSRVLAIFLAAAMLALMGAVSVRTTETQAAGSSASPGTAWAWGYNLRAELGNGTNTGSNIPVQVSLAAGTTVHAVAGGESHSLALTSTGQVLAWGSNFWGQLGNGSTSNSSIPVQVSQPSGTVTAIASGENHSLALNSAGQVLAWGSNSHGQLGNGSTTDSSLPVVAGVPVPSTAIAGGGNHTLALTTAGDVASWGDNSFGQLGNGTTTDRSTPGRVSLPSGTTAIAIAGGFLHSLAVTSTGQVMAWGHNGYGQLGNGTFTDSALPVQVSLPAGTTITAVAAAERHSLALTSTGQVLAWGDNGDGELGNGGTAASSSPVAVSLPAGTTVTAIASGGLHSLALTSTGLVLAWGYGITGDLGNGTWANSNIPVMVSAFPAALAVAAGAFHSLAIQQPAVAVFPAMTDGAYGGYVSAATIQNTGTAPASVWIAYFSQTGAPVGAGDSIAALPVNASWTVRQDNGNSFPSSGGNAAQAGSAVVYSSQPIVSFVNEFPPGNAGDATSYGGVQLPSGVGTTLYAPTIVNNAYGGYTTGIGLLNQGSSPTAVVISYRNAMGGVVISTTLTLAAHAYQAVYNGDGLLSDGFAGTATITSSAAPLGAIVNETGPGGQFSSYVAVASSSTLLNVPVALNNAYGGYYTGMGIQNTSATAGTVSVTYYSTTGTAIATRSFAIAALGYVGVYQGSVTDGPPVGAYTAVIQNAVLQLVAIVNEAAPAGAGPARQSTSYNTFAAGNGSLHLPLVENAGSDPWNTGEGIMNTGSGSTTVTVVYYDSVTGALIGTPQTQTLSRRAFWGLYQPTGGLPAGSRATAVVTPSLGGQVAVICNESSPTTFMSYDGQ